MRRVKIFQDAGSFHLPEQFFRIVGADGFHLVRTADIVVHGVVIIGIVI